MENRQRARIVGLCHIGGSLHHMMMEAEHREGLRLEKERIVQELLERGEAVLVIDDPHSEEARCAEWIRKHWGEFPNPLSDEERAAAIKAWHECRYEPTSAPIPQGRYVVGIDLAANAPAAEISITDVSRTDSSPVLYLSRPDETALRGAVQALAAKAYPPVPTLNRAQRRRLERDQRQTRKLQRRNNNNTT